MSILTSVLESVAGIFSGKITAILPALLIGAALAGGAGLYFYVSHLNSKIVQLTDDKNSLTVNNQLLQQNIAVLKDNQKTLIDSNSTNEQTIKKLQDERAQSKKAIDSLASSLASDKKELASYKAQLDALLKDPKNDGVVSPALRETIRSIQNSRN